MSRKFASRLTKEDLIKAGIKNIYYDPNEPRYHVITNNGEELNIYSKWGYLAFSLYELDENGNRIKVPITRKRKYRGSVKETDSYIYKGGSITLHRAVYAWFHGEITEGLVVDHVDNKHTTHYDNRLENLQLITQKENSTKNRIKGKHKGISELPCSMFKPIQHYIDKCNYWLLEYEREKEERGSKTEYAHKCAFNYWVYKKKINYWYKHKAEWEEYQRLETAKAKAFQYQQERRSKIKQLKEEIKQAKEVDKTLWHKKIKEYNTFLENFPYKTTEELEKTFLDEIKCN